MLFLVLGLTARGPRRRRRRSPACLLLVVLFKIAGLYDRDELRLVHSTLDELPVLLQLTGLFALCVTIVQSVVRRGDARAAGQIAALWVGHVRAPS